MFGVCVMFCDFRLGASLFVLLWCCTWVEVVAFSSAGVWYSVCWAAGFPGCGVFKYLGLVLSLVLVGVWYSGFWVMLWLLVWEVGGGGWAGVEFCCLSWICWVF